MEILILLGLILLNGLFAMSEMAVVTSKKVILQEQADKGNKSAMHALELTQNPDRFLSTVQVGITLIGIVAGAFGGSAIAQDIAQFIRDNIPALEAQADPIGFGAIVLFTTYLSLVLGELVPKRIALNNSERVAMLIAPPMRRLALIATPVVWFLSKSTEFVARLLRIQPAANPVTDTEIIAMMREGVEIGAFDPSEHAMVRGVLELDDMTVQEIMTPRIDLIALNARDTIETSLATVKQHPLIAYPVYDGDIDNIIGVVHTDDILRQLLDKNKFDVMPLLQEPVFVPQSAVVANIVELFRQPSTRLVFVIDEYGGIEGTIAEHDIMGEIMGHVNIKYSHPTQREDGSWLFDGSYPLDDVQHYLPIFANLPQNNPDYNTLAGFILAHLGRIARIGDKITWQSLSLEVVDMDGRRIDQVLIAPTQTPPPDQPLKPSSHQ